MFRPRAPEQQQGQETSRYQNSTPDALKKRTIKARIASLLSKQAKRLNNQRETSAGSSNKFDDVDESFSAKLQKWFFTKSFWNANKQEDAYPGDSMKTFQRDQKRSLYSYIHAFALALKQLFEGCSSGTSPPPLHVLNTHIVDDTSTKMRGPSAQTDRLAVYTVMNTVQTLHVRKKFCFENGMVLDDGDSCINFRIPTPLMILDNPDTNGIYKSFISCAFVTSQGVGKMLCNFGVPNDLVPETAWQTFIFVGDALRANNSAYKQECKAMAKNNANNIRRKHLAIKFKCCIHQTCLIRKPIVLMLPRVWSTIVRLSHLFEGMSFRKSFARTLTALISTNFQYMEVPELPPASHLWKLKSDTLRASFRCQSKMRRSAFESCLDFLNGDLNSDCFFHFCVRNGNKRCCEGKEDALAKILKILVPFCSKGYQVPLLYRFKHYDEAISFISFGTVVHNVLSRTLINMDIGNAMAPEQQQFIDKLLGSLDLGSEGPGTEAVSFENDGLNDSFAAHNAKRKQQVHQEITRQHFRQSALTIDFMIKPMDVVINRLFRRSHLLTQLSLLGPHDAKWEANCQESKAMFLSLVSGRFGWNIISDYCKVLCSGLEQMQDLELNLNPSNLQTVFSMGIVAISDTWRRFVHEYCTYPWKLFGLLGTSGLEDFVFQYDQHQQAKRTCSKCMDAEFTLKLLDSFPECLSQEPQNVQQSTFDSLTMVLHDVATYAPLTSDPVECKNGQVQASTCRRAFNASVKAPEASRETSFLQSIIRDFDLVKHWVGEQTLPAKKVMSGILKRAGAEGTNQFSDAGKIVTVS